MSIFGKLLIVFNLLAAGAFAYFTLQDWKARQEITWNALSREVQLRGIAVEPQNPPPAADELGDKRVAFYFEMPGGLVYRSIPKDRLDSMIPKGDETYRRRAGRRPDCRGGTAAEKGHCLDPRRGSATLQRASELSSQFGLHRRRT